MIPSNFEPVPVTIVTGFLGSGKTTMLNRLLRSPALADTVVIVNEFGEVGLDHLLIEQAIENTVLLKNGCICCTVRGDVADTLAVLWQQRAEGLIPHFSRIAIETTGLADPGPVAHALVAEPGASYACVLDGIVTVVDAMHGMQTLTRQHEARRQVALADRILLSKTDIAPDTAALEARLARLNAAAPIGRVQDEVRAEHVFGLGPAASPHTWLGHHHHAHDEGIGTTLIAYDAPVTWDRLQLWLESILSLRGADVLRLKGLVQVAGEARPVVLQGVHHVVHPVSYLPAWPEGGAADAVGADHAVAVRRRVAGQFCGGDAGMTAERPVFNADHALFREQAGRFIADKISPHHMQWERDGIVPRSVWLEAGRAGLLCASMPEAYGGADADFGFSAVLMEELTRAGASGIGFPLHSDIVAPYIFRYGNEAQRREWLPPMAKGEIIGAIAMTEPGMGSDLKSVRTSARREGGHYVLNGSKTFITNGINAGIVIVVAKTDPAAGHKGISLICVREGTPGFTKGRNLEKIGLLAQDTAELFFDDCRVPAGNRLGEEGMGFRYLMHELAQERLMIAIRAAVSMETMLAATVEYTRDRKAFGGTVFDFQNTRFKLAGAKAEIEMYRVFADHCLALHLRGELTPERAAMAKLTGAEMQGRLLDDFLQLHGGYGFTREYPIARAWTDARVMRIYGGSSEIMKEIIARGL